MEICLICNKKFPSAQGLKNHITGSGIIKKYHNSHAISMKDYYDKFFKKENEGICLTCGKPTKFGATKSGYKKFCSKKCLVGSVAHSKIIKDSHADVHGIEVIKDGLYFRPKKVWIDKYGIEKAIELEINRREKEGKTKQARSWDSTSKEENKLYEFLCNKFGKNEIKRWIFFRHWTIDFYIEKFDLYIEYNGRYWHGLKYDIEEIRYLAKTSGGTYKKILNRYNNDKSKIAYFKKCNIKLIMVNDLDFEKYFNENWVNCWNGENPNQQPSIQGQLGLNEGSETREMSSNNNSLHECPTDLNKSEDIVRTIEKSNL